MSRQRCICGGLALALLGLDVGGCYQSSGWLKHWMASYGHDVLLPMFLYFFNRAVWHPCVNRRWLVALFVFAGATALEFAQLGQLYAGTFDAWDIVAYLVGVALAFGLDAVVVREPKRSNANPQLACPGGEHLETRNTQSL